MKENWVPQNNTIHCNQLIFHEGTKDTLEKGRSHQEVELSKGGVTRQRKKLDSYFSSTSEWSIDTWPSEVTILPIRGEDEIEELLSRCRGWEKNIKTEYQTEDKAMVQGYSQQELRDIRVDGMKPVDGGYALSS